MARKTHSEKISEMEFMQDQHEKDISLLKKKLFGSNGNIGLERRVDRIEFLLATIKRQNWGILVTLSGLLLKILFDMIISR